MKWIFEAAGLALDISVALLAIYLEFKKKNRKLAILVSVIAILIFLVLIPIFKPIAPEPILQVEAGLSSRRQNPAPSITPTKSTQPRTPGEIQGLSEKLIMKLPNGVDNVSPRPLIEITYLNVPVHQYLWLRVYGADKDSNEHIYWPIGHIAKGKAHSIIHDIAYQETTLRSWSSEGLGEKDPWFLDAGKKYRVELIALNRADDEFLRGIYQHEWDTNKFEGVDEEIHEHDLHPMVPPVKLSLVRSNDK